MSELINLLHRYLWSFNISEIFDFFNFYSALFFENWPRSSSTPSGRSGSGGARTSRTPPTPRACFQQNSARTKFIYVFAIGKLMTDQFLGPADIFSLTSTHVVMESFIRTYFTFFLKNLMAFNFGCADHWNSHFVWPKIHA